MKQSYLHNWNCQFNIPYTFVMVQRVCLKDNNNNKRERERERETVKASLPRKQCSLARDQTQTAWSGGKTNHEAIAPPSFKWTRQCFVSYWVMWNKHQINLRTALCVSLCLRSRLSLLLWESRYSYFWLPVCVNGPSSAKQTSSNVTVASQRLLLWFVRASCKFSGKLGHCTKINQQIVYDIVWEESNFTEKVNKTTFEKSEI